MQAAFVVNLEVESVSLEALAGVAGTIQDACEHSGLEVIYVHPYARQGDEPQARPFGPVSQAPAGEYPA